MTTDKFKKLEYILSGTNVSQSERDEIIDLIDECCKEASTPSPALQDAVKKFQIDFGVHVRCHVEICNGFIKVIRAVDGYGNPIESKDVFISPTPITSPTA